MKLSKNDPSINRIFNYLYKITNKLNNKIYMGVHRTDNMDDGYMGSGVHLKRSIKKYGIEHFEKIIIKQFKTYQEALDEERKIVNTEFLERSDTYNLKEGGIGACKWSSEALEMLSKAAKNRWKSEDYKNMMRSCVYDNPERNEKLGKNVKNWIKNNPEKHKERMEKINKNPNKIKNMANKHKGMKRSESAKKNIQEGVLNSYKNNKDRKTRVGKGLIYIYNESTNICKRHDPLTPIPDGWIKGVGIRILEKYIFIRNADRTITKRHPISQEIPIGWIRGSVQKNRTQ